MSKMISSRKPPLGRSPPVLRSRQRLHSEVSNLQTPPGSLTKSIKPARYRMVEEEPEIRPEYRLISRELHALAMKVRDEFGQDGITADGLCLEISPLFERGRLYNEYSQRRNERLSRKRSDTDSAVKHTPYGLGVANEGSKRRGTKKLESVKRSVSAVYEKSEPRYMLRSMKKENKKPPLPLCFDRSAVAKKSTARKGRKN